MLSDLKKKWPKCFAINIGPIAYAEYKVSYTYFHS